MIPGPFLLDPEIIFLNHGSFGACPREVFETYQRWQLRLETQPVKFLQRELPDLLGDARRVLAEFVGAEAGDVVFVPNPTFAVNELARCLPLGPDDDVLATDHEYGACVHAWRFASQKRGFRFSQQTISLPVASDDQIVSEIWRGVTPRTKVLFFSHITSPTALTLPVAEICRRARRQGIVTVVDGAHAPGQLPLDLATLDPDFYLATCHKWLCAPKGSAFLYARRDRQAWIEPLVAGWGWGDERTIRLGSDFLDYHQWLGTHDPSAYLTVPAAIEFQRKRAWRQVQADCHRLAVRFVQQASAVLGTSPVHQPGFHRQMGIVQLPTRTPESLQQMLYREHRIEVPVIRWQDRRLLRVSVQAYNTQSDVDALVEALRMYRAD